MATDAGPLDAAPLAQAHDLAHEADHEAFHDTQSTTSNMADRDEADTCRICRGEGTDDEPLFYPCKCSGSIKYVHQECLMEWLSHTQKKHCELCKTSFRFTKLYHPGMPSRIPTAVFLRRAALHVLHMFLTWCRGILVASVWLVLLPWCMRVVWRSLFWVGDGGWAGDMYTELPEATNRLQPIMSDPAHLETIHSTLDAARAANTTQNLTLSKLLMPISTTAQHQNAIANEPILWTFAKRLLLGWPHSAITFVPASLNSTDYNSTSDSLGFRSPSLLSDISWFRWFKSQTANRFLVDVFEGQIITMLVVVAFILIFLIREWVVQQQPVINMVALGGDGAPRVDRVAVQVQEEQAENVREQADNVAQHGEGTGRDEPVIARTEPELDANTAARAVELGAGRHNDFLRRQRERADELVLQNTDLPQWLRDALQSETTQEGKESVIRSLSEEQANMIGMIHDQSLIDAYASLVAEEEGSGSNAAAFPTRFSSLPEQQAVISENIEADASGSLLRPGMPARDRSFIATEIRRGLEEGNSWSFDNVLTSSENASRDAVPENWDDEGAEEESGNQLDVPQSENDPSSEGSSGSWQQVSDINMEDDSDQALEGRSSQNKGKGRVVNDLPQSDEDESAARAPAESSSNAEGIRGETAMDVEIAAESSTGQPEAEEQNAPLPDEASAAAASVGGAPAEALEASFLDLILDWIYGPADPATRPVDETANDEHVVRNLDEEAPFVPFAGNEPLEPANAAIQDPEVAAAAAQAGLDVNDQEAIEDAEDLEGILELIGMQGPLVGLFQNALFSAVLISATLACAVWLPYLWGKVVILFIGSPVSLFIKLPLQIIATVTDLVVDFTLVVAAGFTYWVSRSISTVIKLSTKGEGSEYVENVLRSLSVPAQSVAKNAALRITKVVIDSSLSPHPGYFRLSINSHAALRSLQNSTSSVLNQTSHVFGSVLEEAQADSSFALLWKGLGRAGSSVGGLIQKSSELLAQMWTSKSYKITLDMDLGSTEDVASALEHWTAKDRLIAVTAGYTFFALAGAVYLRRATPLSSSQQGQKIERIIADILQQAGGVLKVILIISIEMLAFPLYCGLLLDLAMLPLFKNATLYSRWQFACGSPWTAGFVHWFIGTCYMFHFALFVSMCRKIMRKGVLYFIRDPDDPTFHPVRDVLERSVATQLRKIAFSALVYGALVIVCLGGVVWTLSRVTYGVLPIHWTTEAPSLEFPLDLLFYNFLTPVIIKAYKPGESLHTVCTWWFKKCASALRLSHFLFNERNEEEEGHHIRSTWFGWLIGRKGDINTPQNEEEKTYEDGTADAYFVPDGRYVRAPASDQCRVPKGQAVFVDVDKDNVRKDGNTDGGVHNSELVQMVYIPPWFRLRIACFVVTIWIFMGVSGISVTIIPLMFGRYLFSLFLPPTVEMNDIHAFSLGVYTLGSVVYSGYQLYKLASSLNRPNVSPLATLRSVAATTSRVGLTVLRFSYVWASLIFAVPFLCAVLIELYFLMPLHAWMGPSEPHVVHLIQDWTLGFLYSRLAARMIFANRNSRPAQAFTQVVQRGYLYPDAKLATRCFVLPVLALFAVAVAAPALLALGANFTVYRGASEATRNLVWRHSFPAVGLSIGVALVGRVLARIVTRWRLVVRDEVYLIGERLHNFGEKKAPQARQEAGTQTSTTQSTAVHAA
ncbi:RING-type E3 ubiquitin transferase [Ascochyta rabiei]|uniref:RING-type E3 ubiquitin transferase n=1 Tax=Didymella rabiei TaxID=5454 RepID=A0A163J4W6_DIDRA|nr:RING-type E3 ubiquitin transferase [Ascochyta rabiei]KZM26146.1 zinc ion binding [Ascochyta rabiei]UPX09749.1 RING-type E3 ubiquitin transferase [Ascochyta rabiei]